MQPSLVGRFSALQELTLSCNGLTATALPVLARWGGGVGWVTIDLCVCVCLQCYVLAGLCRVLCC